MKFKIHNSVYFILINNVIYYLYGYNKKTQKTADGVKIRINNLKIELLEQIKKQENYLSQFIDWNKEI